MLRARALILREVEKQRRLPTIIGGRQFTERSLIILFDAAVQVRQVHEHREWELGRNETVTWQSFGRREDGPCLILFTRAGHSYHAALF